MGEIMCSQKCIQWGSLVEWLPVLQWRHVPSKPHKKEALSHAKLSFKMLLFILSSNLSTAMFYCQCIG